MLNRNKESIISQSYAKLGELSYEIAKDSREGLDGNKAQDCKWLQLLKIDLYLDTILDFVEVQGNSIYRVIGISDDDFNKLLTCLEDVAGIHDYPIASFLVSRSVSQILGGIAPQGAPGTNGVSSYSAIAFASDASGTDFSTNPSPTRKYVAFVSSNANIPLVPSSFAGRFTKYIADDPIPGIPGIPGTNYFEYIRYATDANGTNFSATPSQARKFIAHLLSPVDLLGSPGSSLFNGLWVKYIGEDGTAGTPGTNGRGIILTSGVPNNLIGSDGDVAIDTLNWKIHTKAGGVWSAGVSLIGPVGAPGTPGSNGANGINGTNAYIYIAWADDPSGLGYTTVFDPNKDWIGVIWSATALTPVVGDFTGKWAKYRGDGDTWKTTSITTLTISTGNKALLVDKGLAYSTGQRIVIALDNDPNNRMEGLVIGYDQVTGQLTAAIDAIFGSGSYASWDVNLSAAVSAVLTSDSYYAEIYVDAGATPQATSTSFAKITQFATLGNISAGMAASFTNDNITPGIGGEFFIYAFLSVTGTASNRFDVQLFKNTVAVPGTQMSVLLDATPNAHAVSLGVLQAVTAGDVYELRVKAAVGTPNFTVQYGRFGMYTTGTPATPEYTKFGGLDFDTGTGVIIDSFSTSTGWAFIFDYKIRKGNNVKQGTISGVWDALGNVKRDHGFPQTLGTIDVTLDVDISGGNVRLKADITSDDWEITGNRYIL